MTDIETTEANGNSALDDLNKSLGDALDAPEEPKEGKHDFLESYA